MRNLILCFLLIISACNPLTKAANSEVELLQEKQQLDRAITTWYSKQSNFLWK
jgi:hypothetical protein